MNDVLKDVIGKFVIVYLDDIVVYGKDQAEHYKHLQVVSSSWELPVANSHRDSSCIGSAQPYPKLSCQEFGDCSACCFFIPCWYA